MMGVRHNANKTGPGQFTLTEEMKMANRGIRVSVAVAAALLAAPPAIARITHIVAEPATTLPAVGPAGEYERINGIAHGTLDPSHPANAIITDIQLAPRNGDGLVEYSVTFSLVKPKDMTKASGLLWHDVPNRGGRLTISADLRAAGDIGLSSGWQGDNSGNNGAGGSAQVPGREYVVVPVAKNPDGTPIQGRVMGRILNAEGLASQRMIVHSNEVPYEPVAPDSAENTLTEIVAETIDGQVLESHPVPREKWKFAECTDATPFPGTPNPRHICIDGGFKPNRAYQAVFTTQGPPVLGIGFAAFRDIASFFKNDTTAANPVRDHVKWILARGNSQSGNFLRAYLHLGFNEDEAGRQVQDGNWPIIAGRRVSLNTRFAMPDGVLKLYEPGSEGPQWWGTFPDTRRGLPPAGILDRCEATKTCPKIIEHFGAAEIWGLKLGPEWVGTDPKTDIPLPKNVRRYYIASTPHGGGNGSMSTTPATDTPSCPSAGYGEALLPSNPMPHAETVNAIRYHFRRWVMNDIAPPASVWPQLRAGNGQRTLVEPTKQAMGFPTLPGLPPTAPTGLINPVLDYDFGPRFDYTDGSGIVDVVPPLVKQVIPALVPRVDADGNELGGVPVVMRDAPLGTYLGWNITDGGFHDGKICNYQGGYIPFARTESERDPSDPRPSLEARYGTHQGYVDAVRAAAARAVASGFLLQADADALVARAQASNVLNP
jgi:hypothetical protein